MLFECQTFIKNNAKVFLRPCLGHIVVIKYWFEDAQLKKTSWACFVGSGLKLIFFGLFYFPSRNTFVIKYEKPVYVSSA